MTDIEIRATIYALEHHQAVGQTRKYTHKPYISHPAEVAEIIRCVPHTPEMIAAAWLHDTVEDTNATLNDIQQAFGARVASLVNMVTDISLPSDGNRKIRKALDRKHLAIADAQGKTIKLADIISNTSSIVANDPKFAKVYLDEMRQLLTVLTEGDSTLLGTAREIVEAGIAHINKPSPY